MGIFNWFKTKHKAPQDTPAKEVSESFSVTMKKEDAYTAPNKNAETFTVPDINCLDDIVIMDNWKPSISVPDYDKLFSLERLLSRGIRHDINVQEIMANKDPLNAAHKACIMPEKGRDIFNAHVITTSMIIKIRTIYNVQTKSQYSFIIRQFFQYVLYRIGELTSWDYHTREARSFETMRWFLLQVGNENDCKMLKLFDEEVLSCFCLAFSRNDEPFSTIWEEVIVQYSEENDSLLNMFISSFGKNKVLGIVLKLFHCLSKQQKYNLKTLLLKEEKVLKHDASNFSLNINEMIKVDTFQDGKGSLITRYYPNEQQRDAFAQEAIKINPIIEKAGELLHNQSFHLVDPNLIYFDLEERAYSPAQVNYNPNTATGKISKYPYDIRFDVRESPEKSLPGVIYAVLYYTQNNEIGKASILLIQSDIKIECKQVKNCLAIGKITRMSTGEVLYKLE